LTPVPRCAGTGPATLLPMSDVTTPLEQQLAEIGTQLAWVRDYL
jgi:hypothetical protein